MEVSSVASEATQLDASWTYNNALHFDGQAELHIELLSSVSLLVVGRNTLKDVLATPSYTWYP